MSEIKKIKVLFVLPALHRAGAEMQLVSLVNGLDAERFEKHLVVFDEEMALRSSLDPDAVVFHHFARSFKYDLSVARRIARLIDVEGIQSVHCTMQIAFFMGWLGAKMSRSRPPVFVALHNILSNSLHERVFNGLLYRHIFKQARRIVFVCSSQVDDWAASMPFVKDLAQVIYNGVDSVHFDRTKFDMSREEARKKFGIGDGDRVLCHVARFFPEKGHGNLIAALPYVVERVPDVRLILAGDGPLRQIIEQQVLQQGLGSHVRFAGRLEDVRPALMAADVSVLPSCSETFSMAMLESMAMSVPVVATDVGGAKEAVVAGRTGELVPPEDPVELGNALIHVLSDQAWRKHASEECRKIVLEKFSRESMLRDTQKMLEESVLVGSQLGRLGG